MRAALRKHAARGSERDESSPLNLGRTGTGDSTWRLESRASRRSVRISSACLWSEYSPRKGAAIMTKYALYIPLEAKPGKEKEVADFLRSAVPLVNAETGTISWFAIQEGPSSFAIFDTFDDEAGRDAHLNGKVAAALMEEAKAGDLFAKAPDIHKLEILAAKRPTPATFQPKRQMTGETIPMMAIVVTDRAAGTAGMKLVERP